MVGWEGEVDVMKHSNNPNQYSISATEKRKLERLLQKGYVSNATKHFFFFFFFFCKYKKDAENNRNASNG